MTRDVVEGDEDGGFTGTQEFDCTSCNGVGRVKKG
ncbi:hypothetical protein FrEUN1fDRAFT_5670 [Parafrankia sp. EUN1f]|nr:hypothetical protein FrEUN1fDRAFT_5670 [Parafrankia sp. EUN1f]